jgi:putative cell wall-binding protein
MRPRIRHGLVGLALLVLSAVVGSPVGAVTTPLVKMTLTPSSNPVASGEEITWTGTITPINGTIPTISVGLENVPATSCEPALSCVIGIGGASWTFTNVSSKVTLTAIGPAPDVAKDVRLLIENDGVGCVQACPPRVPLVVPWANVRIGYTGPSPIVNGSTIHVTVTGSMNAGPAEVAFQLGVPTGFGAPTNLAPGSATWDAGSRGIQSIQTIDQKGTLTFDLPVTAANGTSLALTAILQPSIANYRPSQRTISIAVGSQVPPNPTIERISGTDRFATAAAISKRTYGGDTFVAYIATGRNFPDALVAGPAAFIGGGPVLLVEKDSIPTSVKTELARIQPARIVVLGGTGVISENVRLQLEAYSFNPVTRLSGADRYVTAWKVNDDASAGYTGPVYLATGTNFPDALSGGPAAAQDVAPIVLSTRDSLPSDSQGAIAEMTPTKFVLLGGPGVLSSALVAQLGSLYPGVPVERWSGADRYATSAAISAHAFPDGADVAFLAIGTNYPDALAGGPAASVGPGPILLAKADCLPGPVYDELQRLAPTRIVLLGGPSVLATAAATTRCPG